MVVDSGVATNLGDFFAVECPSVCFVEHYRRKSRYFAAWSELLAEIQGPVAALAVALILFLSVGRSYLKNKQVGR